MEHQDEKDVEAYLNRDMFLENLAGEFRDELDRCGWEMTEELVSSAVAVYLKARVRKLEALDAETANERRKRLEKKREANKRYRQNGKLRDVGEEVFGSASLPRVDLDIPMPPCAPPARDAGRDVNFGEAAELEERLERIQAIAERRRKFT